MKRRYGFVSNSSSSSYIVKINDMTFYKFVDLLYSEVIYGQKKEVMNEIDHRIQNLIEWQQKSEERGDNSFHPIFSYSNHIAELSSLKDKLEKAESEIEISRAIFEYYEINIHENDRSLELFATTLMHNDYDSGLNNMLSEIILYLSFETDIIPVCTRRAD